MFNCDLCISNINKGYSVPGMVNIKDPLLLIRKSSPLSGGSGFFHLLTKWSFIIYTKEGRKCLLNDALYTFYLWLCGI